MMAIKLEQVGVVVVMEKTVVSGLARLALRRGWALIHLPTAGQIKKALGRQPVDIAVVQVAVELEQAAELIRWLRLTHHNVFLVSVASCHSEELEQQVRLAGTHCYLPQADELHLEQAITEILRQKAAPGGTGMEARRVPPREPASPVGSAVAKWSTRKP